MLKSIALLILLSRVCPAFAAQECKPHYWTIHGNLQAEALAYDDFIENLPKDPTAKLNAFIHQQGLLQQLKSPSGRVEGLDDYFSSEGASGQTVGLFLKYMRVPARSNISFDTVFEIENGKSKKVIQKWSVPYGSQPPVAIEGFDLVYPEVLTTICKLSSRKIFIKVSSEGIYRALGRDSFPEVKLVPEKICKAQRELFKLSKTAACGEFKDLVSGTTRTLVWDAKIK